MESLMGILFYIIAIALLIRGFGMAGAETGFEG